MKSFYWDNLGNRDGSSRFGLEMSRCTRKPPQRCPTCGHRPREAQDGCEYHPCKIAHLLKT